MEETTGVGDSPLPPPNYDADFDTLPIPPYDHQYLSSDGAMAAEPFDLGGFGFGFGSGEDYELTFDDLGDLDDLFIPDCPGAGSTAVSPLDSGDSEISNDVKAVDDVSPFLNYPPIKSGREDPAFSESSGGALSSQGSGNPDALHSPSHSGNSNSNSDRDVSSAPIPDGKVKTEEDGVRNGVVSKRKKVNGGGEENAGESRSSKFRRSESSAAVNDEDEKRKARLMRNRESAQLSRQRKKHYVEELEDKVRAMNSTISDLNNRISYVMAENATLKQQLSGGGAAHMPPHPPPPPGMYPMPPMGYPWMPYNPYVVKPQGSQVPLVPIPRLKPQPPVAAPKPKKKSESKKSEGKTKKVASISFLGLLFFLLLFGGLVPMVNVNFGGPSNYVRDRFYDQQRGRVLTVQDGENVAFRNKTHVHTGNASEPLVASLYVPRNDRLVKIDGNLIIHSVLASEKAKSHKNSRESKETSLAGAEDFASALAIPEAGGNRGMHAPMYRTVAGRQKALAAGSADRMRSTAVDGKLQQWFREGLAEPMLSSGMCTEVFQFDVSAASNPGGIVPASSVANVSEHSRNTTQLNRTRNRRILGGMPIPLSGSNRSVSEEEGNNFQGNSSMVVSVLVDPREAGDIDVDGMIKPKSLSRIFVVLLLDSVKYVTYSCVLPGSGPQLVTT